MMDSHNLHDVYEAVATWQRATLELRRELADIYFAEGYDHDQDQVVGEAVILRCLNTLLDTAQDTTAASVLALLREQARA